VTVVIDRCPLCGGATWSHDSIPERNLYSEKLAQLLGQDEGELLEAHRNWRCATCGLLFKRRWFDGDVIRQLFTDAVGVHPRGWDTVLGRFSPEGFRAALERWEGGLESSSASEVRRGERELRSIIGAITGTTGFDRCLDAIADGDVTTVRASSEHIVAAIGRPAPFSRFSGFRSAELWSYLGSTVGDIAAYAEVGCPLWGLLPLAAETGADATFLIRDEVNYWGEGCRMSGMHCATKLFDDGIVAAAPWSGPERFDMVGLFQYLDHLTRPDGFLEELFAKADSAAVVLDGVAAPVAIQHVTGWTETSMAYVADRFGKRLHTDFDAIRESGNVLYLLSGRS